MLLQHRPHLLRVRAAPAGLLQALRAPAALYCQSVMPFAGAPLHAAVPASLFPAPDIATTSHAALPAELGVLLDQKVRDILAKTGAPAMTAAITIPGLGRWSSTQGLAQSLSAQPVDGGTAFYWASVGKALTAVLVLQLSEEGKLGLQHLRTLQPGEDVPTDLATPHAGRAPLADPGAWTRLGAGNVVARAEAMVVFWQVVLSEWTDDTDHPRTWLGHPGGIPTANAQLLYDPAVQACAAVAVNSEVSSAAVANADRRKKTPARERWG